MTMFRAILVLLAASLLAATVDAQTCRPGDPCYQGEHIGGLVIITDAPATRVVVKPQVQRRVVAQAPVVAAPTRIVTYSAPVVTYSSDCPGGVCYRSTTTQPAAVTTTVRKRWFRRGTVTTYHYHR